ncbi:hypothetical protein, partial [Streptomyces europaeiscabiei]
MPVVPVGGRAAPVPDAIRDGVYPSEAARRRPGTEAEAAGHPTRFATARHGRCDGLAPDEIRATPGPDEIRTAQAPDQTPD